jgi:uncharacterized protein YlzI (FlbEa/FlbD family)
MIEIENLEKNKIQEPEDLKEKELPKVLDELPLEEETITLVGNIIKEKDLDNIKNMTKIFQLNQSKKNMLRIIKLNTLLDKVNDQAIERFEKCPDEITTDQLLDYMKVVQDSIDRSQKYVANIDETPMIQFNQQNNVVNNITIDPIANLNRESKEKVMEAINQLFSHLDKSDKIVDVVDVTTEDDLEESNE